MSSTPQLSNRYSTSNAPALVSNNRKLSSCFDRPFHSLSTAAYLIRTESYLTSSSSPWSSSGTLRSRLRPWHRSPSVRPAACHLFDGMTTLWAPNCLRVSIVESVPPTTSAATTPERVCGRLLEAASSSTPTSTRTVETTGPPRSSRRSFPKMATVSTAGLAKAPVTQTVTHAVRVPLFRTESEREANPIVPAGEFSDRGAAGFYEVYIALEKFHTFVAQYLEDLQDSCASLERQLFSVAQEFKRKRDKKPNFKQHVLTLACR